MPKQQWRPNCSQCGLYPCCASEGPGGLCFKCREAARVKAHAERPEKPKADAPPKAEIPFCGSCLTTVGLALRTINPATNIGQCVRCQMRHKKRQAPTLADSYGWSAKRQEPNGVY